MNTLYIYELFDDFYCAVVIAHSAEGARELLNDDDVDGLSIRKLGVVTADVDITEPEFIFAQSY